MASARAMIPLALSRLTDYLEEVSCHLRTLLSACVSGSLPHSAPQPDFPSVPVDVVSSLQRMVEASDEATRTPFTQLLSMLQVLDSRARSLNARSAGATQTIILARNIETYIMNAVEMHALASALFPFARGQSEEMPTAMDIGERYSAALHLLGFRDEHAFPSLFKTFAEVVGRLKGDTAATVELA